jgi:hypothetical protein
MPGLVPGIHAFKTHSVSENLDCFAALAMTQTPSWCLGVLVVQSSSNEQKRRECPAHGRA